MRFFIAFAISIFSAQASAAFMPGGIYICKVVSFDQQDIKAACNPRKPNAYKKIPRVWVEMEKDLKVGQVVSVPMTPEQEKKWRAMNEKPAKGKTK